jgi:SAM-dependent methyltransferase
LCLDEDYQKTIYASHVRREGTFKGDAVAPTVVRLVKRYIRNDVLDIGAGSGSMIRALRSKGYRAKGVDLYSTSDDIVQGSITAIPFASGSFATAFCCDVIEHLTDGQIREGLDDTARILKPGGHLVITTPFDEDLRRNTVACPKCGHEFHRYGHHQSFNEKRITDILADHGFETVSLKTYALGAMAKVPLGRYLHFLIKRVQFDFIGKTMVVVARRC